jgi:sugar/nucleoside kinase (ribokinase family)
VRPELVGLGNLVLDDLVFPDGRTRFGEPGGAMLYAALAAALWRVPTGIVSCCGEDYPRPLLDLLRGRGVDLEGVRRSGGRTLRTWLLYEGRVRRVVHRLDGPTHAAVSPRPADVPAGWARAPAFLVSPMPMDVQQDLVDSLSGSPDALIALDPFALVTDETLPAWRALVSRVDIFLASEDEMWPEAVGWDPRRALASLAGGRLHFALLKRGERGGLLYDCREERLLEWPGRVRRVVDPTGAGDAFASGFLAGLLRGDPLERALARGAVGASFAIEDWGPAGLLSATPEAAEARLCEWFGR